MSLLMSREGSAVHPAANVDTAPDPLPTTPNRRSVACVVVAVEPELNDELVAHPDAERSGATTPANSSMLMWYSAHVGKVTVMMAPVAIGATVRADATTSRSPSVPSGWSRSIEYWLPAGSVMDTAPVAGPELSRIARISESPAATSRVVATEAEPAEVDDVFEATRPT